MAQNNTVIVRFLGDVSGLAASTKALNGQLASVGKAARLASFAFAGAFGGAAVVSGIKASVQAFSDYNEAVNKTTVLFGDAAQTVLDFSQTAADAFGLSKTEALEAAGTFQIYADAAGATKEEAALMSEQLIRVASDLASISNTETADALRAIESALAGQSRPLRRYAILADDAAQKQALMNEGLFSGTGNLNQQQKVLGTYLAVLDQAGYAVNDFSRTSQDLANQQKRLGAEFRNLQIAFGEGLLDGAGDTNDTLEELIGLLQALEPALRETGRASGEAAPSFSKFANAATYLLERVPWDRLPNLNPALALDILGNSAKSLSPAIGAAAAGINVGINKLSQFQTAVESTNTALSGTVSSAIAAGNAMAYYEQRVNIAATRQDSVSNQAIRNSIAKQVKDMNAANEATKQAEKTFKSYGGSVSTTSKKIERDLDSLLTGFEYTTVQFADNTATLTEKQNKRLETLMGAYSTKIREQEDIISATLERINEAAEFSSDVLSTFAGVNLDDFIETDDAGNVNFLADKFNTWASDRAALAQALGPLATVLPEQLMMQILAMDNAPARAIAEALNPANAASAEFTASLDTLTQATQDYLIEPMKAAYGYIGTESAESMLRSAEKEIKKQKKAFKKFVKNQLDTEVTVKVRYEYINPPNPVQTIQAYEARNGRSWSM